MLSGSDHPYITNDFFFINIRRLDVRRENEKSDKIYIRNFMLPPQKNGFSANFLLASDPGTTEKGNFGENRGRIIHRNDKF